MVFGPEISRFDDGHPGGGLRFPRQDDWTGHMMAASSDGEPDKGEPKIKAVPKDPEFAKYLDSIEW